MTASPVASNRQPLVSIIVPAYNCERLIAETLDSCLAQTYPHCEIIIVNDGSTDDTAAVLKRYGDRIRVIDQPNGGVAAARNTGQAAARGEYVAWIDNDDLADPRRIEMQVEVLNRFPEVVLVCSDFSAFVSGQSDFEASHIGTYYGSFPARGKAPGLFPRSADIVTSSSSAPCKVYLGRQFENLLWGNFVHPPTVMARKSALDAVGPCDISLRSGSDYECILRLARTGDIALIDMPLLRYRRSDNQLSSSFVKGETWSEYRRVLDKFRSLEPAVFRRNKGIYCNRMALAYIFEAQTLGNKNKPRALSLLINSLRFSFLPRLFSQALLYILVPEFAANLVRRYRQRQSH